VEQLESGEEILNTYFKENFSITVDTDHLSYFIFCDYNNLTLRTQNIVLENGTDVKVNCEVVINNSEIVSQTYTYTLPDGSIWTGYAHRDPASANQWKTGKLNDPPNTKQTLIRNIYYNTKIQDFRTIARLQKASRRSQNISEELLLKILKIQFKPKKLSPIKFDGKLPNGIKVSLNVERLLEKHSPLYTFISKLQLDNYDWIKKVSAYRKRVKKINGNIVDFSKNEQLVILNGSSIETISTDLGILQYRIKDPFLNSVNTGMYCYGIKITFVDFILQKLKLQRDKLLQNDIVSFLAKYQRESVMMDSGTNSGNYNVDLDMFTTQFIERYKNNNLIPRAVDIFIESYNMISSQQIENSSIIKNNLLMQLTPNTANPDSIQSFVNLYNSLVDSYEKTIKTTNSAFFQEEMYFSSEGQQVTKSQPSPLPISVGNNQIENSIVNNLKIMSEKFSATFEKIEQTTQVSVPIINNQTEILKQLKEESIFSIFDFVNKAAYLSKQIDAAKPENEVYKPDTSVSVLQVKRESSNTLLEQNVALANVKSPIPAKEIIFKETPKISAVIPKEQPVPVQNISRAVAASPTTYTTTGNVSGETLQEVINKMLKIRSKTLLNRRG
jgi:hypothetical protein